MSSEYADKNLESLCAVSYRFENFTEYVNDLKLTQLVTLNDLLKTSLRKASISKNRLLLEKKIEYIGELIDEWPDEPEEQLYEVEVEPDEIDKILSQLESMRPYTVATYYKKESIEKIGNLYYLITGLNKTKLLVLYNRLKAMQAKYKDESKHGSADLKSNLNEIVDSIQVMVLEIDGRLSYISDQDRVKQSNTSGKKNWKYG